MKTLFLTQFATAIEQKYLKCNHICNITEKKIISNVLHFVKNEDPKRTIS